MENKELLVIELLVRNDPGAMSHITGLFARRAFNLEGILCGPSKDIKLSNMFLMVNNDEKLDQIVKQLTKLQDVLKLEIRKDFDHSIFLNMSDLAKLK